MQTTRTIAGHEITLTEGIRYLASRPMAARKQQVFPVSIWNLDEPVLIIPDLSYDQANRFLAEFNNGKMSFEGRVW